MLFYLHLLWQLFGKIFKTTQKMADMKNLTLGENEASFHSHQSAISLLKLFR